MSRACKYRLQIYSASSVTTAITSDRVTVPPDVGDFYIKTTLTEDVSGGVTVTLLGNESDSTTNAFTIDDLGGAASATGVNRAFRAALSAASQEVLPGWLYITTASITGEWTILVELYYSKVDIS